MIAALIGSREAPPLILGVARKIGKYLSDKRVIARSGGAVGMDTNFLYHYDPRFTQMYRADYKPDGDHIAINVRDYNMHEYEEIAQSLVPHYEYLDFWSRWLHARNVCQILGLDLKTPSDFVLYWAYEKNGVVRGGTRTAVNLARRCGIPTYNLYHDDVMIKWCNKIQIDPVLIHPTKPVRNDLSFLTK